MNISQFFKLNWSDWEAPIEYVNWTCKYCNNINNGKSTTCSKCKKKS